MVTEKVVIRGCFLVWQVKGVEIERSPNFYNANFVVENNNNNFSACKLRRYNSLKEEDDEDENNLDPKRVGYEVRMPFCK